MLTLLAFLLTLTLVVIVHEYGHYQVALWCGVRVLRFSIGFGPVLWKKQCRNNMELVLSAIPLGGYVKLLGENDQTDAPQSFHRQSPPRRMGITLAGPLANLLLALLIYCGLLMNGIQGIKPIIGEVDMGSVAAQAGMSSGEVIQAVDEIPVTSWADVHWRLLLAAHNTTVLLETMNKQHELIVYRLSVPNNLSTNPILTLGLHPYQPTVPARISKVEPRSVAKQAGLQAQDVVLAINQHPVADWQAFVNAVRSHPKQSLNLLVQRGQRTINIVLTPEAVWEDDKAVGQIGISTDVATQALDLAVTHKESLLPALWHSLQKVWLLIKLNFSSLLSLLSVSNAWHDLGGPITIAKVAGQSATLGMQPFLQFIALFSISIGVLNLLPIPLLDGGRLLYDATEFFTGRPCSTRILNFTHQWGLVIIVLMTSLALYNDLKILLGTL